MAFSAGTIYIDVKPDTSKFASDLRAKLTPALKDYDKNVQEVEKDHDGAFGRQLTGNVEGVINRFGLLRRNMREVNREGSGLGSVFSLIKWPAIITGIGTTAGAIGSLAIGAIQLVAAAAPLTGVLVAYPGLLLAVGQGFGVVKLALSGVSTALKLSSEGGAQYEAALESLLPSQRAFVENLVEMQGSLDQLKSTAADALLPALTTSLDNLKSLLPVLNTIIGATAREMGTLALSFSSMFTSAEWRKDLKTIGMGNVTILDNLGRAVMGFADGLRNILVAGQPFLQWLTRAGKELGSTFAANMERLRDSGGLTEFFDASRQSAEAFGSVLGNVSQALFNVLKIARPFGMDMMESFRGITAEWVRFTESVGGQNKISQMFIQAQPVLHETAKLIGDIVRAFGQLAQTPGVAALISQLRTRLLPIILDIAKSASGELGPVLVDLAESFLKIFRIIGTETGGLLFLVRTFAQLTDTVVKLLEAVPGLGTLVTTIVLLGSAAKSLGILQLLAYLRILKQLQATNSLVAASTNALAGANMRTGASFKSIAIGGGIATAALTVFMLGLNSVAAETAENTTKLTELANKLPVMFAQGKLSVDQFKEGMNGLRTAVSVTDVDVNAMQLVVAGLRTQFQQGKIDADQFQRGLVAAGFSGETSARIFRETANATNTLTYSVTAAGEKIRHFANMTGAQFDKFKAAAVTSIQDVVGSLSGFTRKWELTSSEAFKAMKGMMEKSREMAKAYKELDQTAIPDKFRAWLISQGPEAVRAFVKMNDEQQNIFERRWKKMDTNVKAAVANLPEELRQKGQASGKAWGEGLIGGIGSSIPGIEAKARAAADAAVRAANQRLRIESPSKVMYQTGYWFWAGFNEGIQ